MWTKSIKKRWKEIVIFTAIFLFTLICNFSDVGMICDNLWNFHMIQKITLGYIPYKEINMIITPLFHFLGALFMKIFRHKLYKFLLLFSNYIWSIRSIVL